MLSRNYIFVIITIKIKKMHKYILFLRGINVGGHHKVSMSELKKELEKLNFNNVITVLNTGNVIIETEKDDINILEEEIATHLETVFGFKIPVMIRTASFIIELIDNNPFKELETSKNHKMYISFLKDNTIFQIKNPWISEDKSLSIITLKNKNILSVIDMSISNSIKAMKNIETLFGKDITTRNWNTIKRIKSKL